MTLTTSPKPEPDSVESAVRSYSRIWPDVFVQAKGSKVWSRKRAFLDFCAAAGSLNYGHDDPAARQALTEYIPSADVQPSPDRQSAARQQFLETFRRTILEPRGLSDYRVVITGPTGPNSVQVALDLAKSATGRSEVVTFLRGFHGVAFGSPAASSAGPGAARLSNGVRRLDALESVRWFERLNFQGRGTRGLPACVLTELVQGEALVNVARVDWARGVDAVCKKYDVPLIVNEIHTGCGRTGPFFAFEDYGIRPDIITVSKSLSGLDQPLSVVLLKPELDVTAPGPDDEAVAGDTAAFVTAAACLEKYWADDVLALETQRKSRAVFSLLTDAGVCDAFAVRGKGLIIGVDVVDGARAGQVARECFDQGLLVDTAGPHHQVARLLPPLTMGDSDLTSGVERIADTLMRSAGAPQD